MDSTDLGDLWDRIFGTQPAPEQWLVVVTATVALIAVVPNVLWRVSRNTITIAHEGGHGLVALVTGRKLQGIRLHSDTSGLTVSRGRPTGIGMILTAAAGYTAPPLLGLGGAWLLSSGRITLLLWVATALLAVMLVMIRNVYGALTVIFTGSAFLLVSWLASPDVQSLFAYTRCGSCCSAVCVRRSSSSRSGAAAAHRTRTRTSCPGSRTSRPCCGCSSSTRSRSAH